MFNLKFATDNAAFDGEDERHESARILRAIADLLEHGSQQEGGAYDLNGNRVGAWSLDEREDD